MAERKRMTANNTIDESLIADLADVSTQDNDSRLRLESFLRRCRDAWLASATAIAADAGAETESPRKVISIHDSETVLIGDSRVEISVLPRGRARAVIQSTEWVRLAKSGQ